METTDEWTIRSEEEELAILYADWESDFAYLEHENMTIPICRTCGNALNTWTKTTPVPILYCGVH